LGLHSSSLFRLESKQRIVDDGDWVTVNNASCWLVYLSGAGREGGRGLGYSYLYAASVYWLIHLWQSKHVTQSINFFDKIWMGKSWRPRGNKMIERAS
jgi:hypothetical protein